jgi:hypothetical protein
MKRRRPGGWFVATAMGLTLLAPIAACESEVPPSSLAFDPGNITQPDTGAPFVPPDVPEAAAPAVVPDAAAAPDADVDADVDAAPPPACNDGKIDPGEICDPLSSCPAACPPIACQLRALEGAGTCTAKCTNTTMQTACVNGDGCCPAACNKTNDDDCAVTCDNGVVEPGETCDPLASCPASCAPIGCQLRTLQNAGTCAAKCVDDKLQTACIDGDGCCPSGCNANNDKDCGPGCGNNVVEPGETCDPLASCPATCPQMKCQLRKLQNAGTCQAACVDDKLQTACVNNDDCCPAGCNANNDNDCAPKCNNGVVEKGETCDPLASCPSACPQLACQLQKLDGAGTCQAACVPAGIQTLCVNNDNCCPKGCDATNDNDCKPVCGNNVIEPGETCDPQGKCPTCNEQYTCYGSKGSAATCDLICHLPVTSCGTPGDKCCPFDSAGGCDSTSDSDCNGGGWKWVALATPIDTSKGCVNVVVRGIVPGGSYDITTCAPPGQSTGNGDPNITQVMDDSQTIYPVANDNCTDTTALPQLAKSECKNKNGDLVMACASPSPGGFIAGSKASTFTVTICAGAGGSGTTPLYVWFNATQEPVVAATPTK